MGCVVCEGSAREIAALRDELAAWRGQTTDERAACEEAERLADWRARFPMDSGPARALIRLVDARGRGVSFAALVYRPGQSDDVDTDVLSKVMICRARAGMRDAGWPVTIEVLRGYGYRLDAATGRALKAAVEGADVETSDAVGAGP